MQGKYQSLVAIEFFIFLIKTFEFSKFYENEAKHDKINSRRGLTVIFKGSKIIKLLENLAENFASAFFLRINNQTIDKFS